MLLRRHRTTAPPVPEAGTPDAPQPEQAAGRSPSRTRKPKPVEE